MARAPDQVLTVAQMQAAEQAIVDTGTTIRALMQVAGEGAAEWVWRMAGGRGVTVLCGPGNNGGDGYVIAEVLHRRGLAVTVVAPLEPKTGAAIDARRGYSGPIGESAEGEVLVDCLFGSGLARPLSGELAALLCDLAGAHQKLVAVDLPSGVESDTGAVLGEGLPGYDLTVALGAWKYAHWLMPAMDLMGARKLVDIGAEPVGGAARLVSKPALGSPPRNAHKYSRGLLAIVEGAMPGAALLASRSAMHGGAGYVKLFGAWRGAPPELVTDDRPLVQSLEDPRLDAFAIGPGLGRDEAARQRLEAVLARDLPTVCDADALVLLEQRQLDRRTAPLILTPHAGELASLCETFGVPEGTRPERLAALARSANATIVGKGPDTIIVSPGSRVSIARPSTSWLATAGTGDVLTGLIASRLAAGVEPHEAAAQGVWLHGEAARLAGPAFTAGELVRAIPRAYAACL